MHPASTPSDPDAIDPAPFGNNINDDSHSSSSHLILGGPDNRRLLPDTANGVHVIDGPTHRHYIGIVDILGRHTLFRRLVGLIKTVKLCDADHSGVEPNLYAYRFHEFMLDNI